MTYNSENLCRIRHKLVDVLRREGDHFTADIIEHSVLTKVPNRFCLEIPAALATDPLIQAVSSNIKNALAGIIGKEKADLMILPVPAP